MDAIVANPPSVSYEIVVVDNASEDGSADAVAAAHPKVTLVRSAVNLGYGPGNNLAFRHSSGEYLLLLGSDTEVRPGALDALLRCYWEEAPTVGAVTPLIEGPTGFPERANYGFPSVRDGVALYLEQPRFARHIPLGDAFDYSRRQPVAQASGTCLLMERALIEQIGFFDAAYQILYTDVELCQRIHDAGEQIIYTGGISLLHYSSQSCRIARGPVRTQMYLDTARYSRSRFGRASLALMLPILGLRLALVNKGRGVARLVGRSLLAPLPDPSFGNTRSGR